MSEVKERILGAVTIMSEEDAQKVWDLIRATFSLSNLEETIPDDEETAQRPLKRVGNMTILSA